MSFNCLSAISSLADLCPQFERAFLELRKRRPVGYEETAVFSRFLSYAKSGCYVEMEELGKKAVVGIKDAGPLVELAEKMNRAAAPIVFLCKEGREKGKEAQVMHKLAIGLSEVNSALFKMHLAETSAAIREAETELREAVRRICHVQRFMETLTPDQISEVSRQLDRLCVERLNQIDPKGTLREELKKSVFDALVLPRLPQFAEMASGIVVALLISKLSEMAKQQGGALPVLFSAYVMASMASSLVRVAQSQNILSALVAGSIPAMILYGQIVSLTE